MGTGLQNAELPLFRMTPHIHEQRQVAVFQVAANALNKTLAPCFLDTKQAHHFRIKFPVDFLVPVAFPIRAGANGMMPDAAFVQRFRQTVEQHCFSRVRRATYEESRKQIDSRCTPIAIIRTDCCHMVLPIRRSLVKGDVPCQN